MGGYSKGHRGQDYARLDALVRPLTSYPTRSTMLELRGAKAITQLHGLFPSNGDLPLHAW